MASAKEKSEKGSGMAKAYLILYNTVQTVGWSFLFYKTVTHYLDNSFNKPELFETVKVPLFIFQYLAILEIVHAITKIVRANPLVTALQVYSRLFVVGFILIPIRVSSESVGFPLLMFAWTITEIVRYSNYALNLLNAVPYFLVWLRYSTFFVLYPMGVTGELLCMYMAYKDVAETQLWTFTMPNKWNFIFNYAYFILGTMLMYIPVFPQLFLHMYYQRRKILGGDKKKTH